MEENMVKDNTTDEVESGVGTEPTKEASEKLFTQEQVNEIIKKRLKDHKEMEVREREVETRTSELTARESRLNCREYLMEKGYPSELLDIIDTSDVDAFKSKADKASGVFESRQRSQFVAPLASMEPTMYGEVRTAFENTKHEPRPFPPR